MAVEIYLEPELQELSNSKELTDEWKNQCIELGLKGQLSMINQSKDDAKPSPYIFMNHNLRVVFATLCPSVVGYKEYNKSTIPLEVLAQIALCEKRGYFKTIKIWYDDISPDPVVVGYIKDGDYSWNMHLIARFGDEILPIETLQEKAKLRVQKHIENEIDLLKNSYKNQIENLFTKQSSISFQFSPVTYQHNHD